MHIGNSHHYPMEVSMECNVDQSHYVHICTIYSTTSCSRNDMGVYVGASSRNESLGTLRVNPCFDGFRQYMPGTVLCQSFMMIN